MYGNVDDNIPERLRIVFDIRDDVKVFVDEHITQKNGTTTQKIKELLQSKKIDTSIFNMANAILNMQQYLQDRIAQDAKFLDKFFPFFRTKVLLIYVSSQNLDDAFRMFTVLNNRGVKLRNADILKADNLSAVKDPEKQKQYAKIWESIENYFGDEFLHGLISSLFHSYCFQTASATHRPSEHYLFKKPFFCKNANICGRTGLPKVLASDSFQGIGLPLRNS